MTRQQHENLFEEISNALVMNCSPEEVFGEDVLHDWAKDNGYVLKDDIAEAAAEE